ncbi:hypothetical protein ACLOJK_023763 [Asimina triloba]
MVLVEGSSTVFQTVYDLPPGYHQCLREWLRNCFGSYRGWYLGKDFAWGLPEACSGFLEKHVVVVRFPSHRQADLLKGLLMSDALSGHDCSIVALLLHFLVLQYKYLVDGVWRHDEQKPCVTDEFGIVNNIVLVREVQPVISLPPIDPTIQPNMDVDPYQHAASSSGVVRGDFMARIPDVGINASRGQISVILSNYTAYELLPQSGKVFALDAKLPVKRAFDIMYEQGLAIIPVWDDYRGQFHGMLTASDFILILRQLTQGQKELLWLEVIFRAWLLEADHV